MNTLKNIFSDIKSEIQAHILRLHKNGPLNFHRELEIFQQVIKRWNDDEPESFKLLSKKQQDKCLDEVLDLIDQYKKTILEFTVEKIESDEDEDEDDFSWLNYGKPYTIEQYNDSSETILFLEDTVFAPKEVEFSIIVCTSDYYRNSKYITVSYMLEIEVNEYSGEDGAPAPIIQNIPVQPYIEGEYPTWDGLQNLVIENTECPSDWDAWYGNDASSIDENKLVIGNWCDDAIRLEWEGKYDEDKILRFKGLATCAGITVPNIKNEGDEEIIFSTLWDDNERKKFSKQVNGARCIFIRK